MKEIRMLICEVDHPDDLKRIAVGQPPTTSEDEPFFKPNPEAVVEEIKHNESGITGVYKNRMGACYRVGLAGGVDLTVPADNVRVVITAEAPKVGG